jgi:hypothetical protein
MSSRVQILARTGLNGYGEAGTFSAAVTYQAHLSGKRRMVRNSEGQEVVSSQAVYLAGAPAVQPGDRIVLSTDDVGSTASGALQPPILAVERLNDEYGPHHTVIFLE